MKKRILALFLISVFVFSYKISFAEQDGDIQIYVDFSAGSEKGDGSENNPFLYPEQAQEKVRSLNRAMQGDIYVNLKGEYRCEKPLELTEKDSGFNGYTVHWRGIGDKTEWSAGGLVDSWTLHDADKNIYCADSKGYYAESITVNGRRATRARSAAGLENAEADKGEFGIYTTDLSFLDYRHIEDLMFDFVSVWSNPKIYATSVVNKDGKAYIGLNDKIWNMARNRGQTSLNLPNYIENAYELLDEPGEFYIDKYEKKVYYIPREEDDMSNAVVVIPNSQSCITIRGKNFDYPAHDIGIENLKFTDTKWVQCYNDGGNLDVQNNLGTISNQPGAIILCRANNISITDCNFSRLGCMGLSAVNGIKNLTFERNEITDTSAGATFIGYLTGVEEIANPVDKREVIDGVIFKNNYIHDVCTVYRGAAAATFGCLANSEVSHNEIIRVPYSGFSVGWGWDLIKSSASKNFKITNNYFCDVMSELHDGGAIYTLGGTGGVSDRLEDFNIISGNYIKNQHSGTSAMYADNGSRGWLWKENVIDLKDIGENKFYFAFLNEYGGNVYFDNNYTTSKHSRLSSKPAWIKNTHYFPDANWNKDALEIIANAGIEKQYAHISANEDNRNYILSYNEKVTDMKSHTKATLDFRVLNARGEAVAADKTEYASSNENTAYIDADGIIHAREYGKVDLFARAYVGATVHNLKKTLYVDDEFSGISENGYFATVVVPGTTKSLDYKIYSKLGHEFTDFEKTICSDNPEVIEIGEDNTLFAKNTGSANVTYGGYVNGRLFEKTVKVDVVLHGDDKFSNIAVYNASELTSDAGAWKLNNSAAAEKKGDTMYITAPGTSGTSAYFENKKFANELLTLDVKIPSFSSGWPSVIIRAADCTSWIDKGTFYIFTFKTNEIELQRFNNGVRTVIFGTASGENICGAPVANSGIINQGQKYKMTFGAVNEANGTRIILNVDGKNIISFLDTTEGRIKDDGYFGIMAFNDAAELSACN